MEIETFDSRIKVITVGVSGLELGLGGMSASEGHLSYVGLGGRGSSRRVATSASGRHPQREAGACTSDRISRGSFSNYRRLTDWMSRALQAVNRSRSCYLTRYPTRPIIYLHSHAASELRTIDSTAGSSCSCYSTATLNDDVIYRQMS